MLTYSSLNPFYDFPPVDYLAQFFLKFQQNARNLNKNKESAPAS